MTDTTKRCPTCGSDDPLGYISYDATGRWECPDPFHVPAPTQPSGETGSHHAINFVSEVHPRPDDPSCTVCGAMMTPSGYRCLSCGGTSTCTSPGETGAQKAADEILHCWLSQSFTRPIAAIIDDVAVKPERDKLRELAAIAYQIVGVLGAPARILDYFSAIAQGKSADDPLPFSPDEVKPAMADLERRNAELLAALRKNGEWDHVVEAHGCSFESCQQLVCLELKTLLGKAAIRNAQSAQPEQERK